MQPPGPPFATEPGSRTSVRWSPELAARLAVGMPPTVVAQLALPPPLSRLVVLVRVIVEFDWLIQPTQS